ncbi:hypothetical protein POM88_023924 [Heracleum sosnowskyi]|uniref:DC1 domain-containing protein n=1 Tax=Heracleum sosnowskyi TaxID=360622 RepID=A0AAD8IJL1_9APIA|nr:hypothetical protein POM88_023924 [Heracleum sosnowskyi]
MEGLNHPSHKHPLVLSKYTNLPSDALCYGCNEAIITNTNVYRCSTTSRYSSCTDIFLHQKCSTLPPYIQHNFHIQHMLHLVSHVYLQYECHLCGNSLPSPQFFYVCNICSIWICLKCALPEPDLNHASHNHVLTLLPLKSLQFCGACGSKGSEDYSYFAHIKCALSATESGEEDVGDVDDPDLVHFPVSDNNPLILYQLIQKFAENLTTSTDKRSRKADKMSHCGNGHSLIIFFDNLNNENVGETKSSDHIICDGCVQPIQSPPDYFYGCRDCNFFLHSICAAGLPREIQHESHPQHELIRCDQPVKPNAFFTCAFCQNICNGIFYSCKSCSFYIDLVCAALPSKIKHDTHKHNLKLDDLYGYNHCDGCRWRSFCRTLRCEICNYQIHIGCARKPGRIKHRWDEHQLCLMYPPVKGHPHDFNCEQCSVDINPNHWFYHCRKCDTSFHAECLDQVRFANIKCGAIVKDDDLHQHSLKISPPGPKFKCGSCGFYKKDYRRPYFTRPILTCVSCKFSVCYDCTYHNGHKNKIKLLN